MGVFSFDDELHSTIVPAKLYKALAKDADDIVPKVIEAIQSVEIVEGNGGPGTIKKLTAVHGGKTSYVLHKLDAIDEANFGYNYSLVGGTDVDESLEKVTFETKIVAGPSGGSIVKISVKYHTKGDLVLSDAVRDETKAKGTGLLKAIEGYVLANPDY
ncbi:ABA-responsive protein ABR17-like [Cicer arietinum]|uniref:ABA-responsive protein ABR17-like n=1 Tax=Cicer arietinum TaxID=3827 RepID=Q9SMK8_CICAR|nr:ABA-responsive protein ABR17-like [Cicer arietinum]CAB61739.1 putative ABA-responsive protein [Cicer arietinum]